MPSSFKKTLRGISLAAVVSLLSLPTLADLPLTVEDLITDKGKVKLDVSLSYANRDRQGLASANPITVQTGPTSFVTLPALTGETQGNSDTLVGTMGLRYGLTAKAEIYGRASYLHNSSRSSSDLSATTSSSDSRFADAWAGVNYQFKKDDDTPAVLGFAEVALREKHRKSSASFKSWMLGATTYKAIDPVVLSLTAGYRFNLARKDGELDYKPGNSLFINPSVAFAVNDRITLTTGVQWLNRQADRLDGIAQGFRRTSTDLQLGMGYGIAKGSTLNLTFKSNISGRDGADLRLSWQRSF